MPAPRIALVFTDLDNTLYDWVAWYSRAFYRLLDGAAELGSISPELLRQEVSEQCRRRHRLEEPEALLAAPSVLRRFGEPARAREALREIFAGYYPGALGDGLRSYPGVRPALKRLAAAGVAIVGHTEAPANHAAARLRALGLEQAFAALLAAPPTLDDPTTAEIDLGALPFEVRVLGERERKPNPAVVLEQCRRHEVAPRAALYVGDSLGRDVRMAHGAGMWTAWARYGTRHDPRDWQRVVDLSPWTEAERAQACRDRPLPESPPDVILRESFDELLEHFDFGPRPAAAPFVAELAAP